MTQVQERVDAAPPQFRWPRVPEYDNYVTGRERAPFEATLNAVMRTTEHMAFGPSGIPTTGVTEFAVDELLKGFLPWERIGRWAVVQGFGMRSGMELGAMRVDYSVAPCMDEYYEGALEYICSRRELGAFRISGGRWRERLPRLYHRPVKLVPDENLTPWSYTVQQDMLSRLNDGGQVKLLELLDLGISFQHYGDGEPLP